MIKSKRLFGFQLVFVLVVALLMPFSPAYSLDETEKHNCGVADTAFGSSWSCCLFPGGYDPENEPPIIQEAFDSRYVIKGGLKQVQKLYLRSRWFNNSDEEEGPTYSQALAECQECLSYFINPIEGSDIVPDGWRDGADGSCLPLPGVIPNGTLLHWMSGGGAVTWLSNYDVSRIGSTTTYAYMEDDYHFEIFTFAVSNHFECVPEMADSDWDGDGIKDCIDSCPFESNPGYEECTNGFVSGFDWDGDGVGNCLDNCGECFEGDIQSQEGCLNVNSRDLSDCDDDGLGDVCDCNIELKKTYITEVPPGEELVLELTGCALDREEEQRFPLKWTADADDGLELTKVTGEYGKITIQALSGEGYAVIKCTSMHLPEDDPDKACFVETVPIYFGCSICDAGTGTCKVFKGGNEIKLGSIDARLFLGRDLEGRSAGQIVLKSDTVSPGLSTPAALKVYLNGDSWATYSSGTVPSQIVSREVCADIEVIDAYKYNIHFYEVDPESAKWQAAYASKSLYVVDSEPLITTYTIENPAASPDVYNTLEMTENRGGSIKEYTYNWDEGSSTWSLAEGNDRVTSKNKITDTNGDLIEAETVADGLGSVSSVIQTTFREITCNGEPKTVAIQKTVDPGNFALSTATDYYEDGEAETTTANAGLIQSRTFPDGSWVKYEYEANPLNPRRKTKEIRSWLDQPMSAPESDVRVITYDYYPVTGSDTWDFEYDLRPRQIVETIEGKEVSREYYVYIKGTETVTEIHEKVTTPGASYGNASNLRTTTVTHLSGDNPESGRIKARANPDGTRESYEYRTGTYDPVSNEFDNDEGTDLLTVVTNGLVADPYVVYNKNTREEIITNDLGEVLARKTYVIISGMGGMEGYALLSWAKMTYDAYGRLIQTDYSNGTSATATWDCCHKTSETDIYGITTSYTGYDGIGRLTQFVRNGITTDYTYDADGRRLTQTVSAGALSLSSATTYDTAGRLDTATDTANLLTDHVYSSPTITTVISPGGATQITETYIDGRTKSITGTGVVDQYYTYGINADGTRWTRVDTGSAASARYEKTTYNMTGNVIEVEKPGPAGTETTVNTYDYGNGGRLKSTAAPGMAVTRYIYDDLGNVRYSGLDVDNSGSLELSSTDRIQKTDTQYVQEGTDWWQVTTNEIYATENDATATTTGIQKTRVTGLGSGLINETVSIDIHGNQTTSTTTLSGTTLTRTVDYPDSAINEITVTQDGLVTSQTSKTGVTVTFNYDALGRRIGVTDPRTGTSITHYNTLGQVDYVQDPAGHKTTYTYDPGTGRMITQSNDLNQTTRFSYTVTGQLEKKWGDAVEPVQFAYDSFGRMTQMYMYRNGSGWDATEWPEGTTGDSDITLWDYSDATGLLAFKTDDNGYSTAYTYYTGGRLKTRTWARQGNTIVTTYGYDPATGDLLTINYSDATPDVTYTYNRTGQQKTVSDVVGTRIFAYNEDLQLTTETIDGTTGLYSKTITRTYDTSGVPGRSTGFTLPGYSAVYGYDSSGRMNAVTWNTGAGDKTASYTYVTNSNLLDTLTMGSLVTDYAYESQRNVKTQVKHTFGGTDIVQYDYTYNAIGQRDRMDITPDLPDVAAPEAGSFTYTPDNLNQYDAIDQNGAVDNPVYDEDGNMTELAGMNYAWNGENRMIAAVPTMPAEGDKKIECAYDYMGRRVQKKVYTYTSGAWSQTSDTRFVYDGWNLIQELDGTQAVQKEYVWGLDLSQSLQDAGGVGGLLAMEAVGNTYLYCHDANGNVGRMISATDGSISAAYEYTAFGVFVSKSGSLADENAFRFSTKYQDDETGQIHYIFRIYDSVVGRWTSQDPLEELGSIILRRKIEMKKTEDSFNSYVFAQNEPSNLIDPFGLIVVRISRKLGDPTQPTTITSWSNPLRHEYLVVSGAIYSFQAGSNMFWSQGWVDIGDEERKYSILSIVVCDDDEFDKYVIAEAENYTPKYNIGAYPGTLPHLLGARNCQSWAATVLRRAKKEYLKNENCPKCFQ